MAVLEATDFNFDVDRYMNRFVPHNRVHVLPRFVSHFLGYRVQPYQEPGNVLIAWWSFVGAFVGISVVAWMFRVPLIASHGVPTIIASSGAAAVLEYNMIHSPAAQPRSSIFGHFQSVIIGVGIQKLFRMGGDFEHLRWLAGALSVGLASGSMVLTKTVYPPGGATALLAVVDPTVQHLGWYLVGLVMLSTTLTLGTSLMINNIQRQYPTYWLTPAVLNKTREDQDFEKFPKSSKNSMEEGPQHLETTSGYTIKITEGGILVPQHMDLTAEEKAVLENLRDRLADGMPTTSEATVQSYSAAQLTAEDEKRTGQVNQT